MYYSNIKIINKAGNPINSSDVLFVISVMYRGADKSLARP
jgi:hypothetical protein